MAKLTNTVEVSGEYKSLNYTDTTQLVVELSALSVVKTADKMLWIDDDQLTYTVLIKNTDPDPDGDIVSAVRFEDFIDPTIALLDTNSVTVDDEPKYETTDFTYDATTGKFIFETLGDIDAGNTVKVVFRITKR